jgi:proline iminopeptidase
MNAMENHTVHLHPFTALKHSLVLAICISLLGPASAQEFQGLKTINGVDLFVTTMGDGTPIIFLHGGPGLNHSYFLPHVTELANAHKLIFFDQRASGQSAAVQDSASMTLDKMTDDIEEIRKTFANGQVIIIAHSWGGLLGMKYASKYPSQLRSLILVSSVSPKVNEYASETAATIKTRTTREDSVERSAIITSEAFKSGKGVAYEKLLKLALKPSFHDKNLIDTLNLAIDDNFASKRRSLFLLARELSDYDLYPGLRSIKVPVLVVRGESDATPLALSQKIQSAIPNSQLVVMKNAGHFPFVEQPKEFARVVLEFIGR